MPPAAPGAFYYNPALAGEPTLNAQGEVQTVGDNLIKGFTPARVNTVDPQTAFEARARELQRIAQELKTEAGRADRQAELGYRTEATAEAAADRTQDKIEGIIDARIQLLIDAAGTWLTNSQLDAGLKAAGWSEQERRDALSGAGIRYTRPADR